MYKSRSDDRGPNVRRGKLLETLGRSLSSVCFRLSDGQPRERQRVKTHLMKRNEPIDGPAMGLLGSGDGFGNGHDWSKGGLITHGNAHQGSGAYC